MLNRKALRGAGVAVWVLAAGLHAGCGEDGEPRWPLFTDICAGLTGVSLCSLAWGDYDGDGDLDLALAGGAIGGKVSKVYRNDGSGVFTDVAAELIPVYECSIAWGDYDNDGDLDLALAGWDGSSRTSKVYRNDGETFTDVDAGLDGYKEVSLAWGDYDNDGDLDLVLEGSGGGEVYRNEGGVFAGIGAGLPWMRFSSVAWGDYDNDADLDLAAAGGSREDVFRNDGAGVFAPIGAVLLGIPISTRCSLAWGDYDNDGDLDLAFGGEMVHGVLRNDGNGVFTDIGAGREGAHIGCSLAWGDYDNDGDLDLVLAGFVSDQGEVPWLYRNDGGDVFTEIDAGLLGGGFPSLAWGDYDNDGDLDLALAAGEITRIYRNNSRVRNAPPTAPCALASTVLGGDVLLSWNAATDAETPTPGVSYNLRVRDDSGGGVMPGMADPVTGYRRIPALGNAQKRCFWILKGLPPDTYYWSVQTIDTAYAGSPWAPEESVTVP